jgi:hypothetical protein
MNEIVATPKGNTSMLLDVARFEMAQRAGKLMSLSALFPDHLKGGGSAEIALANAVMVMNIADRMREDPLAVAQNVYFVRGKPGWNASYMISRANQSGRFKGGIRFKIAGGDGVVDGSGAQKLKDYRITAYADLAGTSERVDAEVTMADAHASGWSKRGRDGAPSKYETMGRQMLQYRAATLLVRLYCPEVMLGYSVVEELEDVAHAEMRDVTPTASESEPDVAKGDPDPVSDAQVVEDKPKQTRKPAAKKETSAKPAEKKQADKDAAPKGGTGPDETKAEPEATSDDGDQAVGSLIEDAEAVDGDFDITKVPDEIQGPFEQISESYAAAKDIGEIEGLNDLFKEALDHMGNAHPDVRAELQSREDAAREDLAARED